MNNSFIEGLHSWRLAGLSVEFKQTFRSLAVRNYRLFAIGHLISTCGTWMQTVALSWLVYRLTGSAAALGVVSCAGYLPLLCLGYVGGFVVDRLGCRPVLIATQVVALIQAALLFSLTVTNLISIYWIIGLSLTTGLISAFELPARQSLAPSLVSKADVTNAIGINSTIWNTARSIGPALAGLLIGTFGESICFGLNALSYLASLVTLLKIDRNAIVGGGGRKQISDKTASIGGVLCAKNVRDVLVFVSLMSIFGYQCGILLPIVADKSIGGGAITLGLLSTATGIGALLSSLILASRGHSEVLRRGIGYAGFGMCAATACIAYSTSLAVTFMACVVAGVAMTTAVIGGSSLLQSTIDPDIRGRIMALFSSVTFGITPVAALIAGTLSEVIGVTYSLSISSLLLFTVAVIYLAVTKKPAAE
ncbi:MAG: MFS transporter [Candidatus Obscuribacterales bacterium]|nr:MFS transporter [Candidatus Obscuribacterales bacterium]